MKVVVVFLGLALLLGVACSRREAGAPPLLDESAPYEITRAEGTPTLEPATLPAVTPSPTIAPPASPPTKRPSPTLSPAERPTPAPTTIVAGYTRKEEPCDDRTTPSPVFREGLGGWLCAFYYPPETQVGSVPFESIKKGYWSDLHPRDPTLLVSGVNEGLKARVFLGVRVSGGYGIHVVNVSVEESHIRLTVVVTSPLPSQAVFAAMTHPFHVVVIAKEDIVSPPGTTWSMVTKDGKVLAETVYPPVPTVPFFSIAKGAAGSPRLILS